MKRVICIILAIAALAVTFAACGEQYRKLERIDLGGVKQVTIAVKADEDPAYTILKRKGIVEVVDLYNSAAFTETDKVKPEELRAGTLYTFKLYGFEEEILGECSISPDGYLLLPEEKDKVFLLKDGFDEEALLETIKQFDVNAKV